MDRARGCGGGRGVSGVRPRPLRDRRSSRPRRRTVDPLTQPVGTLPKAIGRVALTGLVLNSVIGSSVFGLPSVIAGQLGGASPWAWLLAGLGMVLVVAAFAEVASRFHRAGGTYLYARVAFGRFAGIEMAWLTYLVRLTAAATNANLFVIYLAEFWPGATAPVAARLVLAGVLLPLVVLNYRGIRGGVGTSTLFAAAKLTPLAIFVVAGLWAMGAAEGAPGPARVTEADAGTWLEAILLLVFAYGGFEAALLPLGEARNPRRDAPAALFTALGLCALIYTLVQVVVLAMLADPAAADRPLAAAAQVFL
ncbi:MAG TPA: APC family permease, partial [Gemmatimonadales bacterium]|nr:APC family permease [Gemmatimonadales bacterium]